MFTVPYCYTFAASVDNTGGLGGVVTHTVPAMGQHTYQPPAKSPHIEVRNRVHESCSSATGLAGERHTG